MTLAPLIALTLAALQDPAAKVDVLFSPTEGRAIEKRIADEIGRAKKRVSVAIYQFTSKQIAEALASAKARGVDVRVLLDGHQADYKSKQSQHVLDILEKAKLSIRMVYPEGVAAKSTGRGNDADRAKFHDKFCVVDGATVITGSYNWTVLADEQNHENLLVLSSRDVARKYADQFDKVWKDEKIVEAK